MKIAAVTITYNRPKLLGRLIHCFEMQTLPLEQREMVILDDSRQYPSQPSGPGWRVVSVADRFPSLGAKRNAAVDLVSPDTEAIAIFDDDDFYTPDALAACANGLLSSQWVQARQVLEWTKQLTWVRTASYHASNPHRCAYHGAWAYRLAAFKRVGGYPEIGEEDNPLAERLTEEFGVSGDTICPLFPDPWYAYSRGNVTGMLQSENPYHVSDTYQKLHRRFPDFHTMAWDKIGESQTIQPVETIPVGWDRDYLAIEIPQHLRPRPW